MTSSLPSRRLSSACLVAVLATLSVMACAGPSGETPHLDATGQAKAKALAVAMSLKEQGLPVGDIAVCIPPAPAPDGHPRPDAAAFSDNGLTRQADPRRISYGGVVEVFGSPAAVLEREKQLAAQAKTAQAYGFDEGGHALLTERQYSSGPVLLRLAGAVPEVRAATYRSALKVAADATADPSLLSRFKEAPCST